MNDIEFILLKSSINDSHKTSLITFIKLRAPSNPNKFKNILFTYFIVRKIQ